ncbi:MAG: hypothetical protein DRJ40_10805 [Thermoprotei archaeon]|nr:MAG: hypothetical protein DRJ40_10805 [Thermoprotei archaeon]
MTKELRITLAIVGPSAILLIIRGPYIKIKEHEKKVFYKLMIAELPKRSRGQVKEILSIVLKPTALKELKDKIEELLSEVEIEPEELAVYYVKQAYEYLRNAVRLLQQKDM